MMRRGIVRAAVAAGVIALGASAALAGAGSAPLPPPDPTAKNLSVYRIQLRAFDACLVTQSRLQGTTREAVHTPCSCYAKGTVNAMTKAELAAFRETGYFNDSAREKGLQFIDKCKLKRP
jgi:predicted metal-binding protein